MSLQSIRNSVNRLLRDRNGSAITEYIIIVGLIAILAIAAYRKFGDAITNKVKAQTEQIDKI